MPDYNIKNPSTIANVNRSGTGIDSALPETGWSNNFDWFSAGDGKALPISARDQFGAGTTMDEMENALLNDLGLSQ